MNLSKVLKQKRDAEDRLRQSSPQVTYLEDGAGGQYINLASLATKSELASGLEGKANTAHSHTFLNLTDTPESYVADKVVKVNLAGDALVFGDGGGSIEQATETTLGGIKAKAKTTESSEVVIDLLTGKLYVPASGEAANGLPSGGTTGQILSKIDEIDYNTKWINAPSGTVGGTPVLGIDGCAVWLKADSITGLADGDAVNSWSDSAKGKIFCSFGTVPIYKANIINGKPVVHFNGGYYGGKSDADGFLFTCFIVTKFSSFSGYTGIIHNGGIADINGCFFVKSDGKSAVYGHGATNIYDGNGVSTYDTVSWNISTYVKKSAGIETRRNKTLDKSVASAPSIYMNSTLYIGNDYSVASRFFYGDIAEFIMYNRELTSTEIASIEEYLNTKYALGL